MILSIADNNEGILCAIIEKNIGIRLTFVCEVFGNGSGQSSFSVINVAYFIIIKYKLTRIEVAI
jgi:hypothetical protein